jgi:FO synthase
MTSAPRLPHPGLARTIAIVPVKALAHAKQRLGAALHPEARRRLVLAMLDDVLTTLALVPSLEATIVVTRDREVAAAATARGAMMVQEREGADLNASIAAGLFEASARGAARALIIPGDVPLATPTEIEAVLRAAPATDVVIAPDANGEGTNGLLLPLPAPFETAFGQRSFEQHKARAQAAGCTFAVVEREGVSQDIDLPDDLARLDLPPRYSELGIGAFGRLDAEAAYALESADLGSMMTRAEAMTLAGFGRTVTYSRKVFIPLTQLCRDVCHYCTFAHTPRRGTPAYLSPDEVLAIARAGVEAGCKEALFTLGDKPEIRYKAAREALSDLGYESTLDYLEAMARLVLKTTGLLPHINAGIMDEDWARRMKAVSASQGIMLETASDRLSERGGPHFGSPDKMPVARLEAIAAAGRARVPFTTGLLIGIGETRRERVDALLAIRDLHDTYGHIQEVIIQNFRAKPGTRMANAPDPSLEEHLWSIAAARLILGPTMSVQAPPNLHEMADLGALMRAGVNDWGGVSPVTPDHVNPEAPWPHLARHAAVKHRRAAAGRARLVACVSATSSPAPFPIQVGEGVKTTRWRSGVSGRRQAGPVKSAEARDRAGK